MKNRLCNGVRKRQKAALLYECGTNQDLSEHRQTEPSLTRGTGLESGEKTGSW